MTNALSKREARRLARAQRTYRAGRARLAMKCGLLGAAGGAGFALLLRAMSNCFDCTPLAPPADEVSLNAFATWLALRVGRFTAVALVAAAMFGGGFALFGWRVWPLIVSNYEHLAARAGLVSPGPHDR